MKIRSAALVATVFVFSLFSAKVSSATEVKTDYDRNADFARYKTCSWKKVKTADQLWVDRIKAAIDSALAAKGWTQTESASAYDISIARLIRSYARSDRITKRRKQKGW